MINSLEGYSSDEDQDTIFKAYIEALNADPDQYRHLCVALHVDKKSVDRELDIYRVLLSGQVQVKELLKEYVDSIFSRFQNLTYTLFFTSVCCSEFCEFLNYGLVFIFVIPFICIETHERRGVVNTLGYAIMGGKHLHVAVMRNLYSIVVYTKE
ncbi:unnamed protein product [Fraxinus pennsylvanica]|uniref:Uncharacterized protein n=1 Tax=Fraxinus pennsylvanica TaxID=56036 RepID=A0AAD1YZL0_9LAMI|nr:unnamed protein product [Fraxinus pennsylvanica]